MPDFDDRLADALENLVGPVERVEAQKKLEKLKPAPAPVLAPIGQYILDEEGVKPIPCKDIIAWAEWYGRSWDHRKVAEWTSKDGRTRVSTVFLALDHNYTASGEPILWETMLFVDGESKAQRRCGGDRVDAMAMHNKMIRGFCEDDV